MLCHNISSYSNSYFIVLYMLVTLLFIIPVLLKVLCMVSICSNHRWSQGHKARGQVHKKNPRPRTALLRTDPLEAKDRNARGQGHKRKCSPKKKSSKKFFRQSPKKRSLQKFFRRSPEKNGFQKILQALHKILTIQTIVLSSS